MNPDWIVPQWNAPASVRAISTTRRGGFSSGLWENMNLGEYSGDDEVAVLRNRAVLRSYLPAEPVWLRQEHGTKIFRHATTGASAPLASDLVADAQLATRPGQVCAILSADCLPVLLCNREGTRVAAAHAGWRGLVAGVLERTVQALACSPGALMAWLGPAIGSCAFVVGEDVRTAFISRDERAALAFVQHEDRWLCDLYLLARQQLEQSGVSRITGGGYCTYSEPERFFSYRRDKVTGRMASLVWLQS